MADSKIIERLIRMRTTVRRRLIAYGFCATLAGGVAALLAIVSLDWLLHLPALLRLIVAGLFFIGFVAAIYHWIVHPARARISLDMIASRLEAHFGNLDDRLSSAVSFLEHAPAGSPGLTQRVVANTETILHYVPLESALSLKPLIIRAGLLLVGVVILAGAALNDQQWVSTGAYRYVYPWGDIEWPRDVSILPLTGNKTVAVGESVTVRMQVQRGLHDALRGVVRLREPGGEAPALTMRREADGTFHATIDAVTTDLQYWFEAGDDSTEKHPYTIRAVKRPEVVEAVATVEPPPYATHRTPIAHDLSDGPVRAPIGGTVRFALRASKPIPPDPHGERLGLRLDDGTLTPLVVDPADPHALSASLAIDEDVLFRIELRDADGFENRGAAEYSIQAVPDMPPGVTVIEPASVIDLTPQGTVPLLIRVEDDFGINELALEVQQVGAPSRDPVNLTDQLKNTRDDQIVAAMARHVWNMAAYDLAPGDLLIYRAVARDNRVMADGIGQIGESASLRIKIISAIEFDTRVRSDLAQLETRVRQSLLDQAEVLDRTLPLIRKDESATPLDQGEREAAASLAAREGRLVRRLRELSQRFHKLAERMAQNRAGDEQSRTQIDHLGESLRRIAAEPMASAGVKLGEAHQGASAHEQQAALQAASRHERDATDRLQAVLRIMSQWGSFQEMVSKTRDLLERQHALRDETAKLGDRMLGKSADTLSESERAALKRASRRQGQLAEDLQRLMQRMEELAGSSAQKDPAGAEALRDALRAARAHEAKRHMDEAGEALEQNRTAAATVSQQAAAQAVERMASALREREMRKLEELRKQIERAEDQIARLLADQKTLRAATQEMELMGASERTFNNIAGEQRTLARNTRLLGKELTGVERAADAGRIVQRAADPMREAEGYLRDRESVPATGSQNEAITLLEEALTEVEQAARQTMEEALRRSLQQIRENLEIVLHAQREVNTGIEALISAIERRGRIARTEARKASTLARDQSEIRSLLDAQLSDFDRVVVYRWALERVAVWMDLSRNQLTSRRIDDELVATTDRIAAELEKLIGAIVETQALPIDTMFVEGEPGGGGGSGGQSSQSKPVPTVAELLVLKAMQTDINERTGDAQHNIDPEQADETQLRALRTLGEDQAQVKTLTEMVTKRVRHP